MSKNISQEEVDALFAGPAMQTQEARLSPVEIDALGEVGNICMGTAATTLVEILGRRVTITTPRVTVVSLQALSREFTMPYVVVQVAYTRGLEGINILMLKEDDVRVITDLMMGGEGGNSGEELSELHLSAISEAMNQMMGTAATSMSDMLGRAIDISPPSSIIARVDDEKVRSIFSDESAIVRISFTLEIEGLLTSEIMQLMPVTFGRELVDALMNPLTEEEPAPQLAPAAQQRPAPAMAAAPRPQPQPVYDRPAPGYERERPAARAPVVDARPMQFESFDDEYEPVERMDDSLNLIIDVPMQVTIELGQCKKTVKEILEFNTGTVLILDKLAGEPVEIVVNDKLIARGEVMQIEDNYGVRITEILNRGKKSLR